MKKVIKAQLYIPKMDLETFRERCDYLNILLENKDIEYDTYLSDYKDKEVICWNVVLINNTQKQVDSDYSWFKKMIKSTIGHDPKEIMKLKLDRI